MMTNGNGGYKVKAVVNTATSEKPASVTISVDSNQPGFATVEVTDENLRISYVTVYLSDLERVVQMLTSNPHIGF